MLVEVVAVVVAAVLAVAKGLNGVWTPNFDQISSAHWAKFHITPLII